MSLAGHRLKYGSRHECLIIALTEQRGPVTYKGVKCVNNAPCLPERPTRSREPFGLEFVLDGQSPVRHECQTIRLKSRLGAEPTIN